MIECGCGRDIKATKYKLKPQKGFVKVILVTADSTCACGKYIVELRRTKRDKDTNKETTDVISKSGKDAHKLFDKLEPFIISEIRLVNNANRTYLEYGEFGAIKKCYSNLSQLKIGLSDNTIGFAENRYLKAAG